MKGSAFGAFFWPLDPYPQRLMVVRSLKREIWKARINNQLSKLLDEDSENIEKAFKNFREFCKFASGIFQKHNLEWEPLPKRGVYGLPGGKIDDYEFVAYPINAAFAYFALAREFSEETQLLISKPIVDDFGKQKKDEKGYPLSVDNFELILLLASTDFEDKEGLYENYFFLVNGVFEELKLAKHGVKETTSEPELWNILDLGPSNFSPKHAYGLSAILEAMISDGRIEYQGSLNHIRTAFEDAFINIERQARKVQKMARTQIHDKEQYPEIVSSGSEKNDWVKEMEKLGVQPLPNR